MDDRELDRRLDWAKTIAREAGRVAMEISRRDFAVEYKAADDPVTEADRRIDALVHERLRAPFPDDLIISEERAHELPADPGAGRPVWFLDPLDGTREFVDRIAQFTVLLGLAVDGVPRLGVILRPTDEVLIAARAGAGCWREAPGRAPARLTVAPWRPGDPVVELASRTRHSAAHRELGRRLGVGETRAVGSGGLKLGMIAAGEGDYYLVRKFPLDRWDTCAPEAVLVEAGGMTSDARGRPLAYYPRESAGQIGFLAARPGLHARVLAALAALEAEDRPPPASP